MAAPPTRARPASALLLDAAEHLFAERGVDAVSMREVGLSAGQRNNGVTQYYFGDKDGLVRAVFERRAHVVNERRLRLLEEAGAGDELDLRALVHVHVAPLAEQVARGIPYVRFLSRLGAEGRRRETLRHADGGVNTAHDRIGALVLDGHLGHLPRDVAEIRWQLGVGLAIDALADFHTQSLTGARDGGEIGVFTVHLVDAIVGLLGGSASDAGRLLSPTKGRRPRPV